MFAPAVCIQCQALPAKWKEKNTPRTYCSRLCQLEYFMGDTIELTKGDGTRVRIPVKGVTGHTRELLEKFGHLCQIAGKRTRDENGDLEGDARLLMGVPSEIRFKYLEYLEWDAVARLCAANLSLRQWCQAKNVWAELLRRRFTVRENLSGTRLEWFKEEFKTDHKEIAKVVRITQEGGDAVITPFIPSWGENQRAYAAAYALRDQMTRRPWMEYFVIYAPDGRRLEIQLDGEYDEVTIRDRPTIEQLTELVEDADLGEADREELRINFNSQLRALYEMWSLGYRWRTPLAEESENARDYIDSEGGSHEVDPVTGKWIRGREEEEEEEEEY